MDEYDSLKEEWRNLIGSFMLEFCEIEYVAYKLWTDKKAGNNMPHNFKERAGQVISKLNGNKYKDLRELLERAVKISDKRNTIAHNPMQLHIYEHKKAGTLHPVFAVSSFMGGDYIDLIELKELVAEAVDISAGLYDASGYMPYKSA